MSRNNVEIAPNYAMTGALNRTIEDAMDRRIFTYTSTQANSQIESVMINNDLRDRLNYINVPENIKGLTAAVHKPEELFSELIAEIPGRQQVLKHYYPKDTLGFIQLAKQIQDGDMQHALATVMDYETITMRDAFGNEKNWIYNAGFNHIHSDATIGKFKKNQYQHFFIGIYDNAELDYLNSITKKVNEQGIKSLNKDESVAFEFLSRIGASMQSPNDLINPDKFLLTDAPKERFMSVSNFDKAKKALKELGDKQIANGEDGVSEGIVRLINNIAEIMVNNGSMATGWNSNYDISRTLEVIENVPGAEQLFKKRIKEFGLDPDKISISDLRKRHFDPVHDLIYPATGAKKNEWYVKTYGEEAARDIDPGSHAVAFDSILKAQRKMYPDKDIYTAMHHLAGIDVLQEAEYTFGKDSPLRVLLDYAEQSQAAIPQDYNQQFALKGLLFQAQDSGSMDSLRKYNKNVFATVRSSNGDLYTSTGWKYDAFDKKWVQSDRFTPGAWTQNVTYEITGAEYFYKDSKTAKAISYGRPEMMGEDLVRLDMRIGLLNASDRLSEAGQEIRSIYMPKSMVVRELSDHFRIIGDIDANGNIALNKFGEEQARYISRKVNDRRLNYEKDPLQAYKDSNQMYFLDRAERSYTKRTLSTNKNAILLRDILDEGTYTGINRSAQLRKAVLEASEGKTQALDNILKGTSIGKSATEVADAFSIDKQFGRAWFSNTFTIAETMQKGSLMEQMHKIAISNLNDPIFKDILAKNDYYNKNQLYTRMMDEGMRSLMALLPKGELERYTTGIGGMIGRPVNDTKAYWLNAADFIRGFRDENEVLTQAEEARKAWMQIDLSNPYNTISAIKRATGLKGVYAENDRNVKRNMIAFVDYLTENEKIDAEAREQAKKILENNVSQKSTYGLATEISSLFQGLKGRQRDMGGWAPDEVLLEHRSFLTMLQTPDSVMGTEIMKQVQQHMQRAGKQQAEMLLDYNGQAEAVKRKLKGFMVGEELLKTYDSGLIGYDEFIKGYGSELKTAAGEIYRQHQTAVANYAENLIESLRYSGIGISVGQQSVYASYGKTTIDISHLIPRLRANTGGALSWMLGEHQTRYTAAAGLGLSEGQNLGLKLTSMMDFYQSRMFGFDGKRARNLIQQSIAENKDPLEMLKWILKIPDKSFREYALSKGSPSFDVRNMIYADTAPILSDKNAIERIIRAGGSRNLSDVQAEAISDLKKYYDRWTDEKPIAGLREEKALTVLLTGDNPLINPRVVNADVSINASAKQPGSEQFRIAVADTGAMSERLNDQGKMLAHQMDNSLYFRTKLTGQEARILKDGGISDLGFGPRFATKTEQAIANVTENGIGLSNRVVANALEANDAIKSQIYDMLVQKYQNDKTIASVFGARFMPHEGGGIISSRITDVLNIPLRFQQVKWDPAKMYRYMEADQAQKFLNSVELQFNELGKDSFEFTGYGRGARIKKGDAAWQFYSRYFNDIKEEPAKRDSILNVVYTTRTGNQIIDEATLKQAVDDKLRASGLTKWNQQQWVEAADSMFERRLVAQNVFDMGAFKIAADSEKHESQSMIRAIGQFFNGDNAVETWQKEEKLLRDIFYSDEFNKVAGNLSGDFREGKTLAAKWYYDIANLKLSSPLFENKGEADKIRTMIQDKVGTFIGSQDTNKIGREFYRMMDQARHRLSDDILELTGANFLGKSIDQMAGHGNYDMILFATTNWLEQQMKKNRGAIAMTDQLRREDFARAIEMINSTGAITDRSGRHLRFEIDATSGAAIIETNDFELNPNKLKEAFRFGGNTVEQANAEFKRALSDIRDITVDGRFLARQTELRFHIDYPGSDKSYKISDRELTSYTNTLLDEELINRLKSNMDEGEFKSIFGNYYLNESGKIKKEYLGKSIWGDALDSHFRDHAFIISGKDKLLGTTLYNEEYTKKRYSNDPYRARKTKQLVQNLTAGYSEELTPLVSQEYADNLYQAASLRQAVLFNNNGMRATDLISDVGQTGKDELFFKKAHIGEIDTLGTMPSKHIKDTESIFNRNYLVDITDESLGLNKFTLGREKIALAGINLTGEKSQAEFQRKFTQLQTQYDVLKNMDRELPEFAEDVNKYRKLVNEIISLQKDYSAGNKIKSSISAGLLKSEVAGSINNKVQVFQTTHLDQSLMDFMKKRTYQGKNLADLYKQGKKINYAVISLADLETMGFNEDYFKEIGVSKSEWLKRAQTEGISGVAHRWPSDYWGSSMAVQIYVDPNRQGETIAYDEITAAFMKADSDGDNAQLILNSTRNAKGQYIDALSAEIGSSQYDKTAQTKLNILNASHRRKMDVQVYDTNQMIKRRTDYHKAFDELYEAYSKKILDNTLEDPIIALGKKNPRMDLAGNLMSAETSVLPQSIRTQYRDAFEQHRERIASAIEKYGGKEDLAKSFRNASTAEDAAFTLREAISQDSNLQKHIYSSLGENADAINTAFRNAASLNDARITMLQRIARKGVGLSDTPFTTMDFLRMNALALDGQVLTNSQNIAMDMVKELTKEQLLTPKKMDVQNILGITKNLDTLNDLLGNILKNGKDNAELKRQFTGFIKDMARDPNSRYQVNSLLLDFAKEENGVKVLDIEKIAGTMYDGLVVSADALHKRTTIFNLINDTVTDTSRGFKGRVNMLQAISNTASGRVERAIATSNGIEEAYRRIAKDMTDVDGVVEQGRRALASGASGGRIIEKVAKDFRPGKGLAISALGLAAASVFGGYAGGNPARPAQQQAQEIYEQNPAPRNINLADPSLTASNRKQAGYVININAQTQKDKEYASRLITQAVTQNFQNTNVNVSMNVNQQPGNISGNDLMDYLTQAL